MCTPDLVQDMNIIDGRKIIAAARVALASKTSRNDVNDIGDIRSSIEGLIAEIEQCITTLETGAVSPLFIDNRMSVSSIR